MITKTITAENMWSEPIWIGPEERYIVEVKQSTATLSARFTTQHILIDGMSDITKPNTADTRWTKYDEFDVVGADPVARVSEIGGGWFRTGVATGDYTSGQASVKLNKCKA